MELSCKTRLDSGTKCAQPIAEDARAKKLQLCETCLTRLRAEEAARQQRAAKKEKERVGHMLIQGSPSVVMLRSTINVGDWPDEGAKYDETCIRVVEFIRSHKADSEEVAMLERNGIDKIAGRWREMRTPYAMGGNMELVLKEVRSHLRVSLREGCYFMTARALRRRCRAAQPCACQAMIAKP